VPARRAPRRAAAARPTAAVWGILLLAFLGAALLVYRPALRGPFLSDDRHYVEANPYVHELSLENVRVLLDPNGPVTIEVVNYSPLQLLLHAVVWQLCGDDTFGHHLLNVALHVVASLLLVALFLETGIPLAAACLGGALFLLHPANVEAVAWISQLKSSLALVLALAALLAQRRRPALATGLFAAALLSKPTAAFALPVAALLDWTRDGRVRWRWLAVWAGLLAVYATVEFGTHQRSGAAEARLHGTPVVLLRSVVALAGRYALMATSSVGVSAFHEPEPARSWLDPWWLLALPLLALLAWRSLVVLRRRDVELVYWVWAAVSFAPVSQIFPFLYPLADRYLYFILPGLLGGGLLAGREALARLAAVFPARRVWLERGALTLGLLLAAGFAVRSHERAAIWRSNALLLADAAAHYPNGVAANLLRARRAAFGGDADGAVAGLRAALERGFDRFQQLEVDPVWAPVREHPEFRAIVVEMAGRWIESARGKSDPTQGELRTLAHAHIVRGEPALALALLDRALEVGGARDAEIRAERTALRRALESGTPGRVRLGVSAAP